MIRHTKKFQETVVQKALLHSPREHRGIAEEFNVGYSSLKKWIRRYQLDSGIEDMIKKEKRPKDWSRKDRLNALIETSNLAPEELGAYCRRHGIMTSHLEAWHGEFTAGKAEDPKAQYAQKKLKQTEKKVRSLEKALLRKDKALAETAALLVLKKKKANALFGEDEED